MAGPFLREFSEFSIFARFLVKTYKIAKLCDHKRNLTWMPQVIYNPNTAMGFLAIITFTVAIS